MHSIQLKGHERQKNILDKYLENKENIPTGILFSGEEGIGKFEIGQEFSKKFLGENFLQNYIEINLEKILIEDIREIIKKDAETSIGSKRIFLIKNIEKMNNSSANAFLKTLEESQNSIFICTTENKNLLLPTIISRFQEIEFYKLSDSEIKKFLEENNFSGNSEDATKFSFGKINLAKKILDSEKNGENFLEDQKNFYQKNKNFLENISYPEIYKKSEFLFKNKDKIENLIKNEISFLENFLNLEGKKFFGEEKFLKVYENFLELKKGLKSNQNLKLIFDNFYFGII